MAGCKGLRVGGCQVSEKHANWFLADKGASESDVIELLLRVQREVFRRSVVVLAPEVEFAGDEAGRVVRQTAWLREECQGELIDEKE